MHVAGPSGSGKTTLLAKIRAARPDVIVKDLDDFDDEASAKLFPGVGKQQYTDQMIDQLAARRQSMMNKFVAQHAAKPVVMAGYHVEGDTILDIPTKQRLMLNTGAARSAWRAYRRSQGEKPEHRRRLREFPEDWNIAREDEQQLKGLGYKPASPQQILAKLATKFTPGAGGSGPEPCLEGFGSAIGKRVKRDVDALEARLRPGDIVITDPRDARGPDRAFKWISRAVQGTRFGHSALYDGLGHVIEARADTVIRRPLVDVARCNKIMAVSPVGVSDLARATAVKRMTAHVGDDALRVTATSLVRHGMRPTVLSDAHEGRKQRIENAICSSLIANAYHGVPFNAERRISDTRPVDLLHSGRTELVGKVACARAMARAVAELARDS